MRAGVVVIIGLVAGCGENAQLVAAQRSAYTADREVVYREARAVVDERYTIEEEDETAGTIATAWEPEKRMSHRPPGAFNDAQRKMSYARFDIAITGGPPWRVEVTSHAGELYDGARVISPAVDDVQWVVAATNRLRIDIHRRLERYAVAVEGR